MSGSENLPIAFRPATENDTSFIYDSWLKEFRATSFGTQVESDVFFPHYRRHIGRVLRVSQVTVCCNPDDAEQIYGYAVHRLHGDVRVMSWICVKGPFRAMGLGRKLFEHAGGAEIVTHLSNRIVKGAIATLRAGQIRLPKEIIYNPFLDLFIQEIAN